MWAFATVKQLKEKLFTTLARAAEWRVGDFDAQGLANTAWAFETAKQSNEKLFTALGKAAAWQVGDFNA